MNTACPLCGHGTTFFYSDKHSAFNQCLYCHSLVMPANNLPSREREKARYLEHDNDVNDRRFQTFVAPITQAVQHNFIPETSTGLDFGCGHAPVISHVLQQQGYDIRAYDPIFANQIDLLAHQYDYICCCEVIEHFHQPQKMFDQLYSMLLPGGKLYCMTALYHEQRDFKSWQYKNDPTHVFIYHRDAIKYIQQRFGFEDVTIDERLITFTKG